LSQGAVCDVVLTRDQLHYLARYVVGSPSPASPFHDVTPPESLPQPALDDLVARRLLGPQGVEPTFFGVLDRLHRAEAFGGFALCGDALESETVTFFAGAESVAVVTVAAGLRVVAPAPTALQPRLDEVIGAGRRRDVALDEALGLSESRVLAAAVDLLRRESLGAFLDAGAAPVVDGTIAAWIARESPSAQWLVGHIAPLLARHGGSFEPRSVSALVAQLVGRGLLVAGAQGLEPGAALAPLVRRMALLDHVMELRAGRAPAGAHPTTADIVMVRADSGTILLWEAQPDGSLRWVTPSADEAKETATRLLTRADALAPAR